MMSDLFSSKSEARRMVDQNGVSINKQKVQDKEQIITSDNLDNNSLLIQKGKKKFIKLLFK